MSLGLFFFWRKSYERAYRGVDPFPPGAAVSCVPPIVIRDQNIVVVWDWWRLSARPSACPSSPCPTLPCHALPCPSAHLTNLYHTLYSPPLLRMWWTCTLINCLSNLHNTPFTLGHTHLSLTYNRNATWKSTYIFPVAAEHTIFLQSAFQT